MDASIRALHKNFMEWAAGPVGSITLHIVGIGLLIVFASMITPRNPSRKSNLNQRSSQR